MQRRTQLARGPLTVLALLLMVVTACSSQGGQDSTAQAAPAASSAQLDAVKAQIAELSKKATSIGVTEPLTTRPVGKTFVNMQCGSPICAASAKVYQEAAEAAGFKFVAIPTGSSPSQIGSAFDQAVAMKPDALVDGAISPQLFQNQLNELIAGGTKVILYATAPPNPPGVAAFVYPPTEFQKLGVSMADFIYADADGAKVNSLFVEAPEFPALSVTPPAFKDEMTKLCPSCGVDTLNANSTEINTAIPTKVISYLQQHPDTKYVISQFGDLELGLPQALKGAGLTGVKLITAQGTNVNLQYLKDGNEYADYINYLPMTDWQVVDIAARAVTGQKFTVPAVGVQWLTKANLDFDPNTSPPLAIDFKAAFRQLWAGKSS